MSAMPSMPPTPSTSSTSSTEPMRGVRGRRPLAVAAWGLLLAGLDLRINGFDLLPDVLGWIFVLVGAMWLAETVPAGGAVPADREPGRRRLAVLTAVGALGATVLSLPWTSPPWSPFAFLVLTGTVALLLRLVVVQATHGGDAASAARWHRRFVLWCVAAATLVGASLTPSAPVLSLGDPLPTAAGAAAVVVAVVVVAAVVLLVTGVVVVVGLFKDSWRPWARPLGRP